MSAAAAHIRPDLFVSLERAVRAHDLDAARRLLHALAPVIRLVFAEPNPASLKAWLARQGLLADGLRPPMPVASTALPALAAWQWAHGLHWLLATNSLQHAHADGGPPG